MSADFLAAYLEQGGLVKLRRYAGKLGHKFNVTREDAMDLLNDALANLTARADKFRCEQDGSPMVQMAKWAHSALYNVFRDDYRRRSKEDKPQSVEEIPEDAEDLMYEAPQETDDLRRDLRTAFLAIEDPETRFIADLILVQGMTVREAAKLLVMPVMTVQDRLVLARTALRETLKDYRP